MLTTARSRAAAFVAVVGLGLTVGGQGLAVADGGGDGGVKCPPTKLNCDVGAKDPGMPAQKKPSRSGKGKPAGKQNCEIDGKKVPCRTKEQGTFNSADHCYWKQMPKQPKPGSQDWKLATGLPNDPDKAKKGSLFDVTCPGAGQQLQGGVTWAAKPPNADGPDLEALAQQAVKKMTLRGPDIGIAPKPSGTGLVGMPVWMWNRHAPSHTGPTSATASAGSVTVTATARTQRVVWHMGEDDADPVTCTKPGTPYKPAFGKRESPDCGYRYTHPSGSQPNGRYHVSATTTWQVHWHGAGQEGDLHPTRRSQTSLQVEEAAAFN